MAEQPHGRWYITRWVLVGLLSVLVIGLIPVDRAAAFGLMTVATGTGEFGAALDVAGDLAIVGAPGANLAYIYRLAAGTWSLEATLNMPGGSGTERFGTAVAIEGSRALVTAPEYDPVGLTNAGRAYVFVESGGVWSVDAEVPAPVEADGRQFGLAADLSGDRFIVRDIAGLRFFRLNTGTWENNFNFTATIAHQVALDGDTAAVSQGVGGLAFRWNGTTWQNAGIFSQPNALRSGAALVGDRLALGNPTVQLGFNERTGGVAFSLRQANGSWISQPGALHPQPETDMRLGTTVTFIEDRLVTGKYSFRLIAQDAWSLSESIPLPVSDLAVTPVMVDVDEVLIGSPTNNTLYHYRFLPNADLVLQAQADVSGVEKGYPAPFSFTISNRGPETASNVTVSSTLPTGISYVSGPPGCSAVSQVLTCTIGSLSASGSANRAFILLIGNSFPSGVVNLTFTADGDELDPIVPNSSSTATLQLLSQPSTPTLRTPANGAVLTTNRAPAFSWTSVGDPSGIYYDLRFDIVDPPLVGYSMLETSFTPPETLMHSTYYWRVRAVNYQAGLRGQWSETRTFTVNNPGAAPIRTVYDTFQPTFTWYPVTNAFGYSAQISLTETFAAQWTFTLNDNSVIPTNTYTLSEAEAQGNGVYWIRVQAIVQNGNGTIASPWSAPVSFAIVNLNPFGLPAGSSALLPPSAAIESLFSLPTFGQRWGWPGTLSR